MKSSDVHKMKSDKSGQIHDLKDFSLDPFGGLFGSLSQQKVLQELVADPYSTYTPRDLTELTELTEPTVREAITALLNLGIVRNISRRKMRPVYQVNPDSKRIVALMLLTYANLDDMYGENHLDGAVKYYYETALSSFSELKEGEVTNVTDVAYWSLAKEAVSLKDSFVTAAAGV